MKQVGLMRYPSWQNSCSSSAVKFKQCSLDLVLKHLADIDIVFAAFGTVLWFIFLFLSSSVEICSILLFFRYLITAWNLSFIIAICHQLVEVLLLNTHTLKAQLQAASLWDYMDFFCSNKASYVCHKNLLHASLVASNGFASSSSKIRKSNC